MIKTKVSICIITVDVTVSYTKVLFSENCTVGLVAVPIKLTEKRRRPNKICNELTTTDLHTARYHILSPLMYIDWAVTGDWLEQPCCCVERWLASAYTAVLRRTICSRQTHKLAAPHMCRAGRAAHTTTRVLIINAVLLGSVVGNMLLSA